MTDTTASPAEEGSDGIDTAVNTRLPHTTKRKWSIFNRDTTAFNEILSQLNEIRELLKANNTLLLSIKMSKVRNLAKQQPDDVLMETERYLILKNGRLVPKG